LALAHFSDGRFEEAIAFRSRALLHNLRFAAPTRVMAASLALSGKHDKAAEALQWQFQIEPRITPSALRVRVAFMHERVWRRLAEGLRLAGLPE
jgi:hypothetical protein